MPDGGVPAFGAAIEARDRRLRRERILFAVLSAVILVATGVVTTVLVDGTGRPTRNPARELMAPQVTTTTVPIARNPCRAPLTPDEPLRLWIGGDSLAGSLGPALGELAAETGVAAPVYDSRSGSGLSTPDFFDWPEHATSEMERLDPEVVVFIMGTNDYATPGASPGTTTSTTDEPAWRAEYASRVATMLEIFHGTTDRYVIWVGAPPLRDRAADAGVREINAVAREVVGLDEDAEYFDEYDLFDSETGGYTATLPRPGKSDLRVRSDDGVHFSDAGGEVLGAAVYVPVDRRCRLDAQAVEGATQPVVRVPGSSERVVDTTTDREPAPEPTTPPTTASPPTTAEPVITLPAIVGPDES